MATNTAVNTMVPAAAKAGRKANTKANTAARRSTAAVQRARSGARGRVRNSTQVPPTWATAKAIRNAFIARGPPDPSLEPAAHRVQQDGGGGRDPSAPRVTPFR